MLFLSLSLSHRSSSTLCGYVPYLRSSFVSSVSACIQYPSLFLSLDLFVSLRMCFFVIFCVSGVWPVVSHGALSSLHVCGNSADLSRGTATFPCADKSF